MNGDLKDVREPARGIASEGLVAEETAGAQAPSWARTLGLLEEWGAGAPRGAELVWGGHGGPQGAGGRSVGVGPSRAL